MLVPLLLTILCHSKLSWGDIWLGMTAVSTLLLAAVAYFQLGALRQEGKVKFVDELRKQFFTEEFTFITFLLDHDLLEYQTQKVLAGDGVESRGYYSFFRIKQNNIIKEGLVRIPLALEQQKGKDGKFSNEVRPISCYEIDAWFLGPIEDIASYQKKNFIDKELLYDCFSWYIELSRKGAIAEYIQDDRLQSADLHEGVLSLQRFIEKYQANNCK